MRKANQTIPTLTEIRRHIQKFGWNGRDFTSKMSNGEVFAGQCETTATALSEMLTGTGSVHQGEIGPCGFVAGSRAT